MRDPCKVLITLEADDVLPVPCLIHKVTITHANGTAQSDIEVSDNVTADGPVLISVKANPTGHATVLFEAYAESNFDPPVLFETGVSIGIGGSGTGRLFYTLA